MHIGILGTGDVARTLGTALRAKGHDVWLGSRAPDHPKATAWAVDGGGTDTFAEVAGRSELLLNCTSGLHSLTALELAGRDALAGKILVDVANPLDFSNGFPPTLSVCNDDSLGERIQRTHPELRVVKALNTVANALMVDPDRIAGPKSLPICGNDAEAKARVAGWLGEWFGWTDIVDLGDITNARGMEAWLLLWTRLYGALGTGDFHMAIVR
ncbi:MAG: NADP oxidoreductase [Deltaproteobacteria bacterium]|nr:MAG: NADP oxidoreductase [Deltaproteobacteria bacterium]